MPLTVMLDYLHLQKLLAAQLQNWKFKKTISDKINKKKQKKTNTKPQDETGNKFYTYSTYPNDNRSDLLNFVLP